MKIRIQESEQQKDTEVLIKCKTKDKEVENIVFTLKLFDKKISVKKENENFLLVPREIYYFDCVDEKIFCYTKDDVFETQFRLYEIENIFDGRAFLRVSKNMVLNINKIKSFKSQINGRMEAILLNKERVEISRKYVPILKFKLGGAKND